MRDLIYDMTGRLAMLFLILYLILFLHVLMDMWEKEKREETINTLQERSRYELDSGGMIKI